MKLRDAACEYADAGWHVLPLYPRLKAPLGRLVPHGKDDATADLATVLRWWTIEPQANIGLYCHASGLVVIDVDPRNGGDDSFWELEVELGALPETVRAETGGGGTHYFFEHPGEDLVGVLAPGVDLKDRGYVLLEPSVHPQTGQRYAWDLGPGDVPVARLPEAWLSRARVPMAVRRSGDLTVAVDHADPLRRIPAAVYIERLAGRRPNREGWVQCPFHKGGQERTPSLKVSGTIWACYGLCPAPVGKRLMGGNAYDLAALLWGYAVPLRGVDFLEVQGRMTRELGA